MIDAEKGFCRWTGEGIDPSTTLAPDLDGVNVDLLLLDPVFRNLALNAREAMTPGGPLVVETGNVELDGSPAQEYASMDAAPALGLPQGRYVMLAVSDTGHGMAQEVKDHLFEPFFSTKESASGSGLGLRIVYCIVKQSGGGIAVESDSGMGTTVRIYYRRRREKPRH